MPTQTATTITMPQLGESVTEGTIGVWLKQVGDRVDRFDPLVGVETDKVNTEIPSPIAGTLVEILVEPDTTIPVGTPICLIDETGDAAGGTLLEAAGAPPGGNGLKGADEEVAVGTRQTSPIASPESTLRDKAQVPDEMELLRARSSPVVRRIAAEHGIDIGEIEGSGIGGRVTKQDLLARLARPPETAAAPPPAVEERFAPPAAPVPSPVPLPQPEARPAVRTPIQVFPGDEVIPVTSMRRQIAEHMVRSERTAPHVTTVMEVDMSNVVAYRAARKEEFARREGIDLTFLPFAIKAATLALRDHPRLNAAWDEDRIIHRRAINVGVAVGLDDGLIVPVIKNADRFSLAGLMHAVAELAGKAKAGTLTPDDVAGGTFTVNNPGTFGSIASTPILVQPQVAILSTEAIVKRPVVIDDMIAIRSMMNLSLSFDHRVLDGLAGARFLQQVKRWLEAVSEELSLF
jgi:2-oxoisovalerate dehydrogenase E2 component (dihydrolipoyl transacylase)